MNPTSPPVPWRALRACVFVLCLCLPAARVRAAEARVPGILPDSRETLQVRLRLPVAEGGWRLRGDGLPRRGIPLVPVPAVGPDGSVDPGAREFLASIPPGSGSGDRPFTVEPRGGPDAGEGRFRFEEDEATLRLYDGRQPVLVYRQGVTLKPGVPADRARSSYVHPLYGLDGEVLTDDFPEDHHHHRGLFWSWPHVGIAGKNHDLWMLHDITNRFGRWLGREAGAAGAVLGVENGWYVGTTKVVQERVWLTVWPVADGARAIDLDCTWIPLGRSISLAGAEGKSYGGITLRYAPGTNTVITTPFGSGTNDLYMTRLPWADLSRRFEGRRTSSGAALFISPDHPDYPPTWLTRHYGVLCHGWPGVDGKTFPPGVPIRCRYRVWVHRGVPAQGVVEAAYRAYLAAQRVRLAGP